MKAKVVATALLAVGVGIGVSQVPQQPGAVPVEAELLADLDVRQLQSGKTVFARVTLDGSAQDCGLRKGAILQGTVETATTRRNTGKSELALSFNQAQCNGREMQPMVLVLAAMAQPSADWNLAPDTQFFMSMSIVKPLPASSNGRVVSGAASSKDFNPTGTTTFYEAHMQVGGIEHHFPARSGVKTGDVLDMKWLKLDFGTGPHGSSIVSSRVRDVLLPQFTQVLLVSTSPAPQPTTTPSPSGPAANDPPTRISPLPVAAPAVDDIEVCAPPGCSVDLPVSAAELDEHQAGSIPVGPLGYTPRFNKIRAGFDDEEFLAWLGSGQLLFTFNPHKLIRRTSAHGFSNISRVIRAVVLDPASRKVIRTVDWEIADSRRYMWPLEGDRVLVHVGNELRVYGANLEMERSIPLGGPLVFVRIAPNGGLSAVATLRERHSPELHAKLNEELGTEPQEDAEIAILNNNFERIALASSVSDLTPPTLLDEGQVRLEPEPDKWYRLAMSTWDDQRVALARFHSACMPQLTSAAPDLLFLLKCNSKTGESEYRVLRADGKVLLRGASDAQDVGQEAIGNDRGRIFAVKVVHSDLAIWPSGTFKNSDLDSEEVRVYRAQDGKRLLAVQVKNPPASHGGFALSPDGSQLAVLANGQIDLFPIPTR